MDEIILKIDNVSKQYKLGQIGGTTLRDELQRLRAKRRGEEDPTKKIGAKEYKTGETFMALDGVSFEVKKGERVGIIGHNGAGKSTLLKLISRVTAPTEGTIGLNGRVASMLEVGTGFHPELTGRENIYMNGSILGMTKKEIDNKMEDIIEFSEVREFIDTPVKRYSSGMYVKLAFSVVAHLDSEIMIMDEVLAVGDMAFQKKCLDKMREVAKKDGRTILYVSHNMNTIRQLCDRVIVLNLGKIIFDGSVEEAIACYMTGNVDMLYRTNIDLSSVEHYGRECTLEIEMLSLCLINKSMGIYNENERLLLKIEINSNGILHDVAFRMTLNNRYDNPIGSVWSNALEEINIGSYEAMIEFPLSMIPKGRYSACIGFHKIKNDGSFQALDFIYNAFNIEITQNCEEKNIIWASDYWGSVRFPDCQMSVTKRKA